MPCRQYCRATAGGELTAARGEIVVISPCSIGLSHNWLTEKRDATDLGLASPASSTQPTRQNAHCAIAHCTPAKGHSECWIPCPSCRNRQAYSRRRLSAMSTKLATNIGRRGYESRGRQNFGEPGSERPVRNWLVALFSAWSGSGGVAILNPRRVRLVLRIPPAASPLRRAR